MKAAAEAAFRASGSGEQDHQQREKRAGVKRDLADGDPNHVGDMGLVDRIRYFAPLECAGALRHSHQRNAKMKPPSQVGNEENYPVLIAA